MTSAAWALKFGIEADPLPRPGCVYASRFLSGNVRTPFSEPAIFTSRVPIEAGRPRLSIECSTGG